MPSNYFAYIPAMILLLLTMLLAASPFPFDPQGKRELVERRLRETVAERDSLPLERYIDQLREITHLDGRFAESYHELGKAWQEKNSIEGRTQALAAFEKAIQLQPRNTEFRYSLAKLQIRRGMLGSAKHEFKKILELDPTDARCYYELALFEERDMLHYREMVSRHENATIHFTEFAQDDLEEAERLLRTAIGFDPSFTAAHLCLAGLYFEVKGFDAMVEILRDAIATEESGEHFNAANRPVIPVEHLHLFLGLAYANLGQSREALESYEQAFQMMSAESKALFHSLEPVLPPEAADTYEQLSDGERHSREDHFWRERDPLFLSNENERLLEHFGRIAYANLRFSFPERGIEGWKTDRGQTLIRFGIPNGRVRTRPDLISTPTGHVTLNASKEIWDYGDFHMIFEDRFLNQNYSFAFSTEPGRDGKNLFDSKIREEAERFDFPHGGKRLALPHVIAQFRPFESDTTTASHDSTLLEIYFGVPRADLRPVNRYASEPEYHLQSGLFLCDDDWTPQCEWRDERRVSKAALHDEKLVQRWTVKSSPGAYNLSLETLDLKSGHSGVEREAIRIEDFSGDSLRMSTVLLADYIEENAGGDGPFQRHSFTILPSMDLEFEPMAPVYVYYEVYNLVLDGFGRSRYRIEIAITSGDEKQRSLASAMKSLGRFLGFSTGRGSVSSSFQSSDSSTVESLHHAFQLTEGREGQYRLAITITDLNSKQSCSRSVVFNLVETEKR